MRRNLMRQEIEYWLDYYITKIKFFIRYNLSKHPFFNEENRAILLSLVPIFIVVPTLLFAFIPASQGNEELRKEQNLKIEKIVINMDMSTEQGEKLDIEDIGDINTEVDSLLSTNKIENDGKEPVEKKEIEKKTPKVKENVRYKKYKVRKNDSISTIARRFGLRMDSIIGVNLDTIKNASLLQVGQVLRIPSKNGVLYTVEKRDTLSGISFRHDISIEKIQEANNIEGSVIVVGKELFLPDAKLSKYQRAKMFGVDLMRPVSGRISSPYGFRTHPITGKYTFHTGIDIGRNNRYRVKAAQGGKVTYASYLRGYGNFVRIRHVMGFETCYAHLSSINIKRGQWVKKGEVIGRVGNTGVSTGPHLHFEVRHKGRYVNPASYVKF